MDDPPPAAGEQQCDSLTAAVFSALTSCHLLQGPAPWCRRWVRWRVGGRNTDGAEPTATLFVHDVHFGEGEEGKELDAAVQGALTVFLHHLKDTHAYICSLSRMQASCDTCMRLTARLQEPTTLWPPLSLPAPRPLPTPPPQR